MSFNDASYVEEDRKGLEMFPPVFDQICSSPGPHGRPLTRGLLYAIPHVPASPSRGPATTA